MGFKQHFQPLGCGLLCVMKKNWGDLRPGQKAPGAASSEILAVLLESGQVLKNLWFLFLLREILQQTTFFFFTRNFSSSKSET